MPEFEIIVHHIEYLEGDPVVFETDHPDNQFVVLDVFQRNHRNYVVVAEVSEFDESPSL